MKLIRFVFYYIGYFVVGALLVGAVVGDGLSDGAALFLLIAPAVLAWLHERNRTLKRQEKTQRAELSVSVPVRPEKKRKATPPAQASSWRQDRHTTAKASRDTKPKRATRNPRGWVPAGQANIVDGRDIGGMVYMGVAPQLDRGYYDRKCAAFIDLDLPITRTKRDPDGLQMPYWPSYSEIPSTCRATYLDWLAGGRRDASVNPGYMFLYFYGLERRFLVDGPNEAERHQILAEVERLQKLFHRNRSARTYLGSFIDLARVSLAKDTEAIEAIFGASGYELPLGLRLAIGDRLAAGQPLEADWLLSWFLCHEDRILRTPATRCVEEFRALFRLRFDDRFPKGLTVRKPRRTLSVDYRAASGEFNISVTPQADGKPVPDIASLRKPIEIAQEIADEVMEDLDKFSRYLGRNPAGRGSLEAQALLPAELWPLFPSSEMEALRDWVGGIVASGGQVPLVDLVAKLEGARPDKIGKRQQVGAADALARLGFGMAPDPRFALRAPKFDDPVVLFALPGAVTALEDVSPAYRAALVDLAMGSFVAHADGEVVPAERQALHDRALATPGLSAGEKARLVANLDWMMAVPPDLPLLRRKLKDAPPETHGTLRAALVAAAHADGVISPEEVAGIEKIYKALGLDVGAVYTDLHAGGVADAPVTMRAATPGAAGEAIPAEPTPDRPAAQTLDAARIAAIQADTARVSAVLGDIFAEEPQEDEPADEPQAPDQTSQFAGLDPAHAGFVRDLIAREHWPEDDFTELAKRHGLMASGALEHVNEWAFAAHDDALAEEYDGVELNPDLVALLTEERPA